MRKLKTSLKPTVKTTNVLDVKMENLLSKNPVVTVLYTRNDNRYLVCKSASTFKLGFPVIKPIIVNFAVQTGKSTSKDIANQVIDTMRKEFGLDPEILNYYEGTKRPYIYQNEYLKGNDIAFDTRDAGQYVGKPEIVKNPSGEYTDERWLTLSEINNLMNQGLFDENSSYYAIRCSEAKRKRAVLDPRLSLHVYADKDGVHFNNNSKDQMPIKTINMNGLQKWEETDDYIIYLDKDAVMTTVESYVTGTYDLFKERKADVDGAMELLKINNIEWTAEDDSKLILDINKAQLERIANTPTTMEEEDFATQTFTTRAVPTTYECCFRVDKSSGEIYIGEGYENLAKLSSSNEGLTRTINQQGYYEFKVTGSTEFSVKGSIIESTSSNFIVGDNFCASIEVYVLEKGLAGFATLENRQASPSINKSITNIKKFERVDLIGVFSRNERGMVLISDTNNSGLTIVVKEPQITKTSTPKPFVKSIMPSGKLAFVTGATSETHSFVLKEAYNDGSTSSSTFRFYNLGGSDYENVRTSVYKGSSEDLLVSSSFKGTKENTSLSFFNKGLSTGSFKLAGWDPNQLTSFKQLLIYKGNLTEAELKAELEKLDDQGFSYKKTKNTTKGERYGNLESVRNNIR